MKYFSKGDRVVIVDTGTILDGAKAIVTTETTVYGCNWIKLLEGNPASTYIQSLYLELDEPEDEHAFVVKRPNNPTMRSEAEVVYA